MRTRRLAANCDPAALLARPVASAHDHQTKHIMVCSGATCKAACGSCLGSGASQAALGDRTWEYLRARLKVGREAGPAACASASTCRAVCVVACCMRWPGDSVLARACCCQPGMACACALFNVACCLSPAACPLNTCLPLATCDLACPQEVNQLRAEDDETPILFSRIDCTRVRARAGGCAAASAAACAVRCVLVHVLGATACNAACCWLHVCTWPHLSRVLCRRAGKEPAAPAGSHRALPRPHRRRAARCAPAIPASSLLPAALAPALRPSPRLHPPCCCTCHSLNCTTPPHPRPAEGVWYERLSPLVLERIIEEHLLGGRLVKSHVMSGSRHAGRVTPALDITR